MAFRTFKLATWADVQVGDRIRTTSGAEFTINSNVGGHVIMVPRDAMNKPGAPVAGTPKPDGAVQILRPVAESEPAERSRLQHDLDTLAMSTAVALVQLRLSAAVLAEQLDVHPLACGPAERMDVEHLQAHLLGLHGSFGLLQSDERLGYLQAAHDSDRDPFVPHEHTPY